MTADLDAILAAHPELELRAAETGGSLTLLITAPDIGLRGFIRSRDAGAIAGIAEAYRRMRAEMDAPPARSWTLELPPGTPIITGNQRMNRYARNARTQALKGAVVLLARQQRIPPLERADIAVEYESPPRLRARRHPLASDAVTDHDAIDPTVKALTDGLVMAGVLKSDTTGRVRESTRRLSAAVNPRGQVRITVTEVA